MGRVASSRGKRVRPSFCSQLSRVLMYDVGLRVLRMIDPAQSAPSDHHKSSVGRGGHRIDASRNYWDGSGLKIDSVSTDVAWGYGGECEPFCHVLQGIMTLQKAFSNKIMTGARNGEFILWDLNKAGPSKYGAFEAIRLISFTFTDRRTRTSLPRPHEVHPETILLLPCPPLLYHRFSRR